MWGGAPPPISSIYPPPKLKEGVSADGTSKSLGFAALFSRAENGEPRFPHMPLGLNTPFLISSEFNSHNLTV